MNSHSTIRAVVVGATGYTGIELLRLLAAHPQVEIVGVFASTAREGTVGDVIPALRNVVDLPIQETSVDRIAQCEPDAVFLATAHEVSHELAPALLGHGTTVFDLSAAFRLKDAALYPRHYGFDHRHAQLLRQSVYGLVELNREAIAHADLVAVPGCYPTSLLLPMRPLIEAGLIDSSGPLIVDSTSGISGAGKKLVESSLFGEVSQKPYGVFNHRHAPEMIQEVGADVVFSPHVGPYFRGICSTIHAQLAAGVGDAEVRAVLTNRYANEQFVRIRPAGQWPAVNDVVMSNYCDIAIAVDQARKHLIVTSVIDNLLKGASGQAVQCMNVRFGFEESLALAPRIHHEEAEL